MTQGSLITYLPNITANTHLEARLESYSLLGYQNSSESQTEILTEQTEIQILEISPRLLSYSRGKSPASSAEIIKY